VMHFHRVVRHVEGDVGHVKEVVGEVFLDDIALVSGADDEVIDAMGAVDLEDVPEDRLTADFDHGFGTGGCFFGEAGAKASG